MATILNPTPITAATFSGMWITSLIANLNGNGHIYASFNPYDGSNILSNGLKKLAIRDVTALRNSDEVFNGLITSITTEVKRQASKEVEPKTIIISASNPANPVSLFVRFSDESTFRIADCFGLSGSDATFGSVFFAALSELARQADLEVE